MVSQRCLLLIVVFPEDRRQFGIHDLAYFDAFLILAVIGVLIAFLVHKMRRSVAEKGAHETGNKRGLCRLFGKEPSGRDALAQSGWFSGRNS